MSQFRSCEKVGTCKIFGMQKGRFNLCMRDSIPLRMCGDGPHFRRRNIK